LECDKIKKIQQIVARVHNAHGPVLSSYLTQDVLIFIKFVFKARKCYADLGVFACGKPVLHSRDQKEPHQVSEAAPASRLGSKPIFNADRFLKSRKLQQFLTYDLHVNSKTVYSLKIS
jgi:hypothetical protein